MINRYINVYTIKQKHKHKNIINRNININIFRGLTKLNGVHIDYFVY